MDIAAMCIVAAIACMFSALFAWHVCSKINDYRDELEHCVIEIIAEMRAHPTQLYHTLVNKPIMNHNEVSSIKGAISIVTVSIREREPELVKKAHVVEYNELTTMVSNAYYKVLPLMRNEDTY